MGETQALRRFLGPGVAQGESLARPGDLANSVSLEMICDGPRGAAAALCLGLAAKC
jgi:hypothetical protein